MSPMMIVVLQQHEAQLEQSATVFALSQDVFGGSHRSGMQKAKMLKAIGNTASNWLV